MADHGSEDLPNINGFWDWLSEIRAGVCIGRWRPDQAGNRTYDLWNASPMFCQLSWGTRSVQMCDIWKLTNIGILWIHLHQLVILTIISKYDMSNVLGTSTTNLPCPSSFVLSSLTLPPVWRSSTAAFWSVSASKSKAISSAGCPFMYVTSTYNVKIRIGNDKKSKTSKSVSFIIESNTEWLVRPQFSEIELKHCASPKYKSLSRRENISCT